MKTNLCPRRTLHCGTVHAGAFWLDPSIVSRDVLSARILSLWHPGCALHRIHGGILILLQVPRTVNCEQAPGTVLARRANLLTSCPLSGEEIRQIDPPAGSVLLCHEGTVFIYLLRNETAIDLADCVDTDPFEYIISRHLGDPPVPPAMAKEIELEPVESHYEEALTTPPDKKTKLLEALSQIKAERAAAKGTQSKSGGSGPGGLFQRLSRWFSSLSGSKSDGLQSLALKRTRPSPPRPPSAFSKWVSSLAVRVKMACIRLPFARLFWSRQSRYLDKMEKLFESNELDQALRHAISLSTAEEMADLSPSLSVPRPRLDLSYGAGASRAGTSILLGPGYFNHLRALYRQTLSRLEQAGEIDKAAFVLLELLQENEEAVSFLEKHKRFRFAAEVAQARGLAPGIVIRQWFLAGEPAQAILVARRTGAFADAVVRLDRTHPNEAKKLRMLWADVLADAGNYGAAVDVAWEVEEARNLILEWIRRGIDQGGAIAARMLAKNLVLDPDAAESLVPRILEIIRETHPGSIHAKVSLGKAISEHKENETLRALSGFVLRELIKDLFSVRFNPGFEAIVWDLRDMCPDRALIVDLPSRNLPELRKAESEAPCYSRDATSMGQFPLHDGVYLPSGKMLVSLGEAGVRFLSRKGAVITHFDCPAHRLILNDSGTRAIAVAFRGGVCRLTRIDLDSLKFAYWRDVEIDRMTDTYDGQTWFVAIKDSLLGIDVLSDELKTIWRVDGMGGEVLALSRDSNALSVLVDIPGDLQCWTYELPSITLRQRATVFKHLKAEFKESFKDKLHDMESNGGTTMEEFGVSDTIFHYMVSPNGFCGLIQIDSPIGGQEPNEWVVRIQPIGGKRSEQSWKSVDPPISLYMTRHFLVVVKKITEGMRVELFRFSASDYMSAGRVELLAATTVSARMYDNVLCIFDDCGRAMAVSPEDFSLLREHTI